MSKYPRDQDGLFGIDSTVFLWTFIGGALLAGGFFLFGMYYGYRQGYQAARTELGEEPTSEPVASAGAGVSDDSETESGSPDRRAAITEEQLSGFGTPESDDPGTMDTSSSNDIPSGPGVYDSGSGQQSSGESDDFGRTTGQTSERPSALSVSTVDTGDDASAPSGPRTEQESTESTSRTSPERSDSTRRGSTKPATEGSVFTIQAVSFLKQNRAEREVQELKSAGYDATITEKIINGRKWYRVRVGNFSNRKQANDQAKTMTEDGVIEDYWISQVKK